MFQDIPLPRLPFALNILDNADFHAVAHGAHHQAKGGGGFALTLARVNDQQTLFDGFGCQHFFPGTFFVGGLFVGAGILVVGHGLSPINFCNASWVEFDLACHKPRSSASAIRAAISFRAAGLFSSRNANTLSSFKYAS